jgi:acyl-CoA thioesterase-2
MLHAKDEALPDLLDRLDLERLPEDPHSGDDRFRGHSPPVGNDRIFGGLVFAQAMRAAQATVEARSAHSAHGYFLRTGDPNRPIEYAVERIRDGRSFTTRRVVAYQEDAAIFNLSMSFQEPEEAEGRQMDIAVPDEVDGESYEDGVIRALESNGISLTLEQVGYGAVEVRIEEGLYMNESTGDRPPELRAWFRSRGPLPDDPDLHAAILAYASDLTIVVAAQHPMPWGLLDPQTQSASLDHAIWFHDDFRIDDWIYAVHDSPVLKRSRALGRVLFYARDGRLVASAVQEGLMRRREPPPKAT